MQIKPFFKQELIMKKKVISTIVFCVIAIMYLANTVSAEKVSPFQDESKKENTWIRLCLWPNIAWPSIKSKENTHGLSIGIVTFNKTGSIVGADLGFVSTSKHVRGGQLAFYTNGEYMQGGQAGIVNINKDVTGAQVGIYNSAEKMGKGAQVAIVNRAKHSDGLQIGLINIMDNGFFKVFPFFNFPKN
jgi:hypothetical protein